MNPNGKKSQLNTSIFWPNMCTYSKQVLTPLFIVFSFSIRAEVRTKRHSTKSSIFLVSKKLIILIMIILIMMILIMIILILMILIIILIIIIMRLLILILINIKIRYNRGMPDIPAAFGELLFY